MWHFLQRLIMTHVIAQPSIDVKDKACVDACPVDAIFLEDDLPDEWAQFTEVNEKFFSKK